MAEVTLVEFSLERECDLEVPMPEKRRQHTSGPDGNAIIELGDNANGKKNISGVGCCAVSSILALEPAF